MSAWREDFGLGVLGARARTVADAIETGPRGAVEGPFLALLHRPEVAEAVQKLGLTLRFEGTLKPAVREAAVLMVAASCRAAFIWTHHEPLAREAGISDVHIAQLKAELPLLGLNAELGAALALTRGVLRAAQPSALEVDAAMASLGVGAVVELVSLVGYYRLLAGVLGAASAGTDRIESDIG